MPQPALEAFAEWLAERAAHVRSLEAEAAHALYEKNDRDRYFLLMRNKALFLQALPDEAEERLATLPEDAAHEAAKRLNRFAAGAEQALELDSPFYMSALLYPDEHKQGEPNNLDILAAKFAARAGK